MRLMYNESDVFNQRIDYINIGNYKHINTYTKNIGFFFEFRNMFAKSIPFIYTLFFVSFIICMPVTEAQLYRRSPNSAMESVAVKLKIPQNVVMSLAKKMQEQLKKSGKQKLSLSFEHDV